MRIQEFKKGIAIIAGSGKATNFAEESRTHQQNLVNLPGVTHIVWLVSSDIKLLSFYLLTHLTYYFQLLFITGLLFSTDYSRETGSLQVFQRILTTAGT